MNVQTPATYMVILVGNFLFGNTVPTCSRRNKFAYVGTEFQGKIRIPGTISATRTMHERRMVVEPKFRLGVVDPRVK